MARKAAVGLTSRITQQSTMKDSKTHRIEDKSSMKVSDVVTEASIIFETKWIFTRTNEASTTDILFPSMGTYATARGAMMVECSAAPNKCKESNC